MAFIRPGCRLGRRGGRQTLHGAEGFRSPDGRPADAHSAVNVSGSASSERISPSLPKPNCANVRGVFCRPSRPTGRSTKSFPFRALGEEEQVRCRGRLAHPEFAGRGTVFALATPTSVPRHTLIRENRRLSAGWSVGLSLSGSEWRGSLGSWVFLCFGVGLCASVK